MIWADPEAEDPATGESTCILRAAGVFLRPLAACEGSQVPSSLVVRCLFAENVVEGYWDERSKLQGRRDVEDVSSDGRWMEGEEKVRRAPATTMLWEAVVGGTMRGDADLRARAAARWWSSAKLMQDLRGVRRCLVEERSKPL